MWLVWLESLKCPGHFSFAIANVTTFPTSRTCKNFNFSYYTVPAEMLYLQKYLTNFRKLFFGWRIWGMWLFWLKIWRCTDIIVLQMATFTTFPTSRTCINSNFSHYTLPAEMLYLQKYLTNFQKFFRLKDEECGYSGWKFEMHRHYSFAMATLQLFQHPEHVKISIFPITLSQQKCYIFKSI